MTTTSFPAFYTLYHFGRQQVLKAVYLSCPIHQPVWERPKTCENSPLVFRVVCQVERAKDVATSVQSSAFNFSIMLATSGAGLLLGLYFPMVLTYMAIALAIPGLLISYFATKPWADGEVENGKESL